MKLPDCKEAIVEKGQPFCTVSFDYIKRFDRCTPEWCMGCKPISYDIEQLVREAINNGEHFIERMHEQEQEASREQTRKARVKAGHGVQQSLF